MCKIPILTDDKYIQNKGIDYRFYLALLSQTYFDDETDSEYRTLNTEKFFESRIYFLEKMKLSEDSFRKYLNKFLRSDIVRMENDIIKVRVKNEDNKGYFLISEEEIDKLLEVSSNNIKLYLIIDYLLSYLRDSNLIRIATLSKKLGFSSTNSKTIINGIKKLKKHNLIDYEVKETKTFSDGKFMKVNNYYFFLKLGDNMQMEKIVNFRERKVKNRERKV